MNEGYHFLSQYLAHWEDSLALSFRQQLQLSVDTTVVKAAEPPGPDTVISGIVNLCKWIGVFTCNFVEEAMVEIKN